MIEELQRRIFAPGTMRAYLHGVEHFNRYFHRRPLMARSRADIAVYDSRIDGYRAAGLLTA